MIEPTLERRTVVEEIAERLGQRILAGELRPGDPLPEISIAEAYGASRPSARSALRRLEREGLVEHSTHRGARVLILTRDELLDIAAARLVIEPEVVRRYGFTKASLESLRDVASRLEIAAASEDWKAYGAADVEFHHMLVRASPSRRLAEFHRGALRQLRLHFMWHDVEDVAPGRTRRHVGEHREIAKLIARGDREAAALLLTSHLEDARRALSG